MKVESVLNNGETRTIVFSHESRWLNNTQTHLTPRPHSTLECPGTRALFWCFRMHSANWNLIFLSYAYLYFQDQEVLSIQFVRNYPSLNFVYPKLCNLVWTFIFLTWILGFIKTNRGSTVLTSSCDIGHSFSRSESSKGRKIN